jgi:hypothetical protein
MGSALSLFSGGVQFIQVLFSSAFLKKPQRPEYNNRRDSSPSEWTCLKNDSPIEGDEDQKACHH